MGDGVAVAEPPGAGSPSVVEPARSAPDQVAPASSSRVRSAPRRAGGVELRPADRRARQVHSVQVETAEVASPQVERRVTGDVARGDGVAQQACGRRGHAARREDQDDGGAHEPRPRTPPRSRRRFGGGRADVTTDGTDKRTPSADVPDPSVPRCQHVAWTTLLLAAGAWSGPFEPGRAVQAVPDLGLGGLSALVATSLVVGPWSIPSSSRHPDPGGVLGRWAVGRAPRGVADQRASQVPPRSGAAIEGCRRRARRRGDRHAAGRASAVRGGGGAAPAGGEPGRPRGGGRRRAGSRRRVRLRGQLYERRKDQRLRYHHPAPPSP